MPRKKTRHTEQQDTSPDAQAGAEQSKPADFPVVGIGASAGGLAAFQAFFTNLPTDPDLEMAFVLVQHLAPGHKSILRELIQRYTRMQVFDVVDGMAVQPRCVYVIPPNTDLAIFHGRLLLMKPAEPTRPHLPIDHFFRSLAQELREQAVCIVLSGSGSDGTLGVRAVKGAGGMVIVQTPETAEYDSMPQNAIATGLVDAILPPEEMPAQLLAFLQRTARRLTPDMLPPDEEDGEAMQKIFLLLRSRTRHDFAEYKQSTVLRRIERRMIIHQIDSLSAYLGYLQNTPQEVTVLFRELLIGVTSFFRDPDAFAAVKTQVLPRLFAGKNPGETVRLWVPGCSTGEEAFSLAILIRDYLAAHQQEFTVQIFATDIDPVAIERARTGLYPYNIAADVPPEYIDRFFTQEEQHYRVKKTIRDMVTFAEQDIIQDPPFSHIDLLSCRNLLIYLSGDLQKKLLPLFHYALNPQGFLFLGSSETIGEFTDLFATINRQWKIYQRKAAMTTARVLPSAAPLTSVPPGHHAASRRVRADEPRSLRALVEHALLDQAPPCVLINEKGDVLYVHGSTGRYLEPAHGEANLNIQRMVRPGLRLELATAVRKAVAQQELIRYDGLQVQVNGGMQTVNLLVNPLTSPPDPMLLLVIFEERPTISAPSVEATPQTPISDKDQRIASLERELLIKDEYLQTHIEELTTSNEELQSSNEELQSTNEEMDTAREELQSVNEELTTVNAELQKKIEELSQSYDDMNNLLAGTDVGTIFVDEAFRIQRFTPAATAIVNLIPSDVGRPIAHIRTNFVNYDNLADDARQVYQTLAVKEAELLTADGRWFLMRILPYRTQRHTVAGVVLTFIDITEQHKLQEQLRSSQIAEQAHEFAESIVETVREPLLVLDAELRVVSVNDAFVESFAVAKDDIVGRLLYELGNGQWDIPALRTLLEQVLPENTTVNDYLVTHTFENIGPRVMRLNARELRRPTGEPQLILLAIEDVTERGEKR